jgi:hypothetical protein
MPQWFNRICRTLFFQQWCCATYNLLLLSDEAMTAKEEENMQCEWTGNRMKQADRNNATILLAGHDITPPCPNDLIKYVELSSSNNDVVKLTFYCYWVMK